MDKNEILRKAQDRKGLDEMEAQVIQRGSEIAMWIGLLFSVLLMVCKMLADQPWQDLYSVYCAMVAALHFYKWYRLRQRHHLVYGILWAAMAAFLAVLYLCFLFA